MDYEIWEPASVRGYEVSSHGNVRNATTGRVLVGRDNGGGVMLVNLSYQGYSLSRAVKQLVADAFVPKPPIFERLRSCVIRHIDENYRNCRADNLNYALRSDAAFIKRVGVPWGRPVLAVTSGEVYQDTVHAAQHYDYGDDIAILKICMEGDGWHCGETFRWAE